MTTLYLDCEFNGFGGELISLALFNPVGESFYEAIGEVVYSGADGTLDPWVEQHVIPVLDKEPIARNEFKRLLRAYLADRLNSFIIADWPADFVHLFESLMIEGHWEVDIPITAHLLHSGPLQSAVPHNALEDAKALARWHMLKQAADAA